MNLRGTPCTPYWYDANTTVKFRSGRINYENAFRTAWKSDRSKMECRVVWYNNIRFEKIKPLKCISVVCVSEKRERTCIVCSDNNSDNNRAETRYPGDCIILCIYLRRPSFPNAFGDGGVTLKTGVVPICGKNNVTLNYYCNIVPTARDRTREIEKDVVARFTYTRVCDTYRM